MILLRPFLSFTGFSQLLMMKFFFFDLLITHWRYLKLTSLSLGMKNSAIEPINRVRRI
jgi:hypothetical protein